MQGGGSAVGLLEGRLSRDDLTVNLDGLLRAIGRISESRETRRGACNRRRMSMPIGLIAELNDGAKARGLDFSKYVVEVLWEALGKSRRK